MELKNYQQTAINDLERFLAEIQESKNIAWSFLNFWQKHPITPVRPSIGNAIEPYKENIEGVPHICFKVPTAGGKLLLPAMPSKPF